MQNSYRVAFLHPDLGIGGAEQLIVNYALALQSHGHDVTIYTTHHDRTHCFPQTIDGTLKVDVRGKWFPTLIAGRAKALCMYIKMLICTLSVLLFVRKFDAYIVDQVSFTVPLLRLFRRKVIFYCHFPDKLLCVERKSVFKRIYRWFIDWAEELSTVCANLILVNSEFTKKVFEQQFRLARKFRIEPDLLYPACDFSKFEVAQIETPQWLPPRYFLSLNRYERKKGINLALTSFAKFCEKNKDLPHRLIIAGGWDSRVAENVEHFEELNSLARSLKISQLVIFRKTISDSERLALLNNAAAVLYTPENEHFGIVPVETMYMKTPVIACNSGGPLESVLHGQTGFLLEPNGDLWAEKMSYIAKNEEMAKAMGRAAKLHVAEKFGLVVFAKMAEDYLQKVIHGGQKSKAK